MTRTYSASNAERGQRGVGIIDSSGQGVEQAASAHTERMYATTSDSLIPVSLNGLYDLRGLPATGGGHVR